MRCQLLSLLPLHWRRPVCGLFSGAVLLIADYSAALPAEPNQRLQSDGSGWRLDHAQIIDARRPRVLLMGDSLLNGDQRQVIKALAGAAAADVWVNPYHQSGQVINILRESWSMGLTMLCILIEGCMAGRQVVSSPVLGNRCPEAR